MKLIPQDMKTLQKAAQAGEKVAIETVDGQTYWGRLYGYKGVDTLEGLLICTKDDEPASYIPVRDILRAHIISRTITAIVEGK